MNRQTHAYRFHRSLIFASWIVLVVALFAPAMSGQSKSAITGRVADSSGAVLQGARVELQPRGIIAATNSWGEFTFANVPPGAYTVTISYVGFETVTQAVTVGTNPVEPINVLLKVTSRNEEIVVVAPRVHGEAEAINRTRSADNILQVIPADVITSLPNANIADALGRMPSVTLERDEGEGKYVQIRGTEPRLSNVTIDGVNVPSPESGVRQIKLDTVASDLVESIEVNKTLQANQDGDGIGGSVNLKTKTAGDIPTLTLYGLGGYTPIIGGRGVDQFGGTVGQRFGPNKKLGILFGGTYDWNGRGINDIEPVPTTSSITPHYDSMDQRDYMYYRTRWGLTGSMDYKLNEGSGIYLRGLYSTFRNWGQKWVYTLNDGPNFGNPDGLPQASQDWRRPDFAIGNLVAGGKHVFQSSWLTWDASVSRSRSLNGDGGVNYAWNGPDITATCGNVPGKSVFRPQFSPACFTPGAGDATDIRNYVLTRFRPPPTGLSAQLNLQGSASFAHQYHLGSHYGIFEFGGKIRNAHKFDDTQQLTADFTTLPSPVPAAQFMGTFTDPDYYDKTYHFTNTPDYKKVEAFALSSGLLTGAQVNSNNYNLIERVSAGYLMNTIDLSSRFRLVAGIRFEATHVATMSFNGDDNNPAVNVPGGSDYLDVLPSVSLRIGITKDSAIRGVFSRGIARPDPQDIAQASSTLDTTQTPNTITLGNPNLKAEHSNNYDLLFEQYLNPVGIIQAGFFYKQLGDPIVNGQFAESPSLFANQPVPPTSPYVLVSQVQNIGSAHLWGFEVGYSQRLSRLPGVMKGLGLSANYSYTNSRTDGLEGLLRDDHPALLRQAPHTWNISPTYDTNKFSMRVGMTYNSAMIFAYQFQDLQPGPNGIIPIAPADLAQSAAGGVKGPGGDNYLYTHYQIDVQGSYKISRSFSVYAYGLNLNNEVFGFYNGSPQYVVQREYYKPTYAGGVRYTFSREK